MIIAQVQARSGPTVIKLASIKGRCQQESSASRIPEGLHCRGSIMTEEYKTGSSIVGPQDCVHGCVPTSIDMTPSRDKLS